MLAFFVAHCTWVTSTALLAVLASTSPDGFQHITDNFCQPYSPQDAVVMGWWDLPAWLTERRS